MKGLIERNKRFMSIVLVFAIILLVGVVPVTANAAGDVSSDDIITNDENGIPDTALYNVLLERCDTNGDGYLQQSEADEQIGLGIRSTEDNQISSLRGLNRFFKNIGTIIVEYNYNLKSLEGIEGMKPRVLIARRNSLTDISQVIGMEDSLGILNVEDNCLTELPDLRNFPNLLFEFEPVYGYQAADNGITTSFLNNYLSYEELDSKLPEYIKNQTEAIGDGHLNMRPIYDGKTLLQYWADFQKEMPPTTDPGETQPTETVPNTDPTETQPDTEEILPQPTADPELYPTETLPDTSSDTEDNTEHNTGNVQNTDPIEDETQDTTAAPAPDKSDNDNNGNNGDNANTGNNDVNNSNVGSSAGGSSAGSAASSTVTGNQGKSAGVVNTGDNYFVFTLALIAIISSSFLFIKNRKRKTVRYK